MTTSSSNFDPNNSDEPQNNETAQETNNTSARITLPQEPLVMGYILQPAQILINHVVPPGTLIQNPNVNIQEVQFICPDIDIAPLFLELQELKITLKEILNSKALAQEIGNELVGETYLRWDTQVRFYPTIVFIFLEDEQHFIKRSLLDPNLYKKKVQIKLRITNHTIEKLEKDETFLKTYILELRSKISNLADTYNFNTGNLRCTYVNQGSVSWKTTVFAKDKEQAFCKGEPTFFSKSLFF